MKHVWILYHDAQSPEGPGGTRHFSIARHLANHGWSSEIFAASVEHNTGRQRIQSVDLSRVELVDGVRFTWVIFILCREWILEAVEYVSIHL